MEEDKMEEDKAIDVKELLLLDDVSLSAVLSYTEPSIVVDVLFGRDISEERRQKLLHSLLQEDGPLELIDLIEYFVAGPLYYDTLGLLSHIPPEILEESIERYPRRYYSLLQRNKPGETATPESKAVEDHIYKALYDEFMMTSRDLYDIIHIIESTTYNSRTAPLLEDFLLGDRFEDIVRQLARDFKAREESLYEAYRSGLIDRDEVLVELRGLEKERILFIDFLAIWLRKYHLPVILDIIKEDPNLYDKAINDNSIRQDLYSYTYLPEFDQELKKDPLYEYLSADYKAALQRDLEIYKQEQLDQAKRLAERKLLDAKKLKMRREIEDQLKEEYYPYAQKLRNRGMKFLWRVWEDKEREIMKEWRKRQGLEDLKETDKEFVTRFIQKADEKNDRLRGVYLQKWEEEEEDRELRRDYERKQRTKKVPTSEERQTSNQRRSERLTKRATDDLEQERKEREKKEKELERLKREEEDQRPQEVVSLPRTSRPRARRAFMSSPKRE